MAFTFPKKTMLCLSLVSLLTVTACDQIKQQIPQNAKNSTQQCSTETSQQSAQNAILEKINELGKGEIKKYLADGEEIDVKQFNAVMSQIKIDITDIRTTKAEKNSKQYACAGRFSIQLPTSLVEEANLARAIEEGNTVQQYALLSDLNFDNNTLIFDSAYSQQTTDDGKKILTQIESLHLATRFISTVIVDALRKPIIEERQRQYEEEIAEENKIAEAEYAEQAKIEAEANKTKAEYQAVLEKEAQQKLDKANAELNHVWNDSDSLIRQELLANQKIWLEKRKLECKMKVQELPELEQGVARIKCEESMTIARTAELKGQIANKTSQLQKQMATAPTTQPTQTQ